jgi:hypothetical protein
MWRIFLTRILTGASDSGEEVENVKVYRQRDGRTTGDQKYSLELSALVS